MRLRHFLRSFLLLCALFLGQYALVTNGAVTGGFYTTDTGRLTPWPTLLPIAPYSHVWFLFRPVVHVFVYPAYLLCRLSFGYSARHPEGVVTAFFLASMRSPREEHLFLTELALFNTAVWLSVLALWHRVRRYFSPRQPAA